MNLPHEHRLLLTRRHFFGRGALGLGTAALASLLSERLTAVERDPTLKSVGALPVLHFAPKAKRVIYLFMSGGPSHIDLFDYKPKLREYHGQELPGSVRMGQRVTGMTASQKSFPCVAPMFKFAQHGKCGAWVSELLPHTAGIVDDMAVVKSLHTEAINHDPAVTFIQTGHQQPGRPSLGSWLSYGIGSESQSLPAFVVMISQGSGNKTDQPLFSRLWGSGFLPTQHQGVRFRSGQDPVLYLSNPPGVDAEAQRRMLDGVGQLNQMAAQAFGDPEIQTRIAQYEMAFRMQTSVPELTDLSRETRQTLEMYGINDSGEDGGFARNCLLARRMIERGVRFVQLFHRGWDQQSSLPKQIRGQCKDVDRPSAALVKDLKRRGLLDETLVIWGGEFGRTVYSQGTLTKDNHGRDHHGRCFTSWLAGGGIRPGITYGETDDYCYNVVKDPVHIHDFNATILHALGIDHTKLTYRFQGRDFRLTDVHGNVVKGLFGVSTDGENRTMENTQVDLKQFIEGGDGIFVIRGAGNCRSWNGIQYKPGLSAKNVPARKLSMNVATIPPGGVAYAHIHVDFEVMLYILQGRVRHEYGPALKQSIENEAGDFIYIEPGVPHEVFNCSDTEPVVAVVARSDASEWENIIPYERHRAGS